MYEPAFYKEIQEWTLAKYRAANPGKKDSQIFDGNCKFAIKEFFKDLYAVDEDTEEAIQAMAYAESLVFFKAFGSYGSASRVRKISEKSYTVIFLSHGYISYCEFLCQRPRFPL